MNRFCSVVIRKSLGFGFHRMGGENCVRSSLAAVHFVVFKQTSVFRALSGGPQKFGSNDSTERAAASKRKVVAPKITLIAQKQMTVTSLEEAQKLAKRRDLHLVQLQEFDTKNQRPVYKLATDAEMLAQELGELKRSEKLAASMVKDKNSGQKKSEKSLSIGARISEHDLSSRLKHIVKWLAKQHEVRILIQGNAAEMPNIEKIITSIEQSIKEPEVIGKIVQKRNKGNVVKFSVIPVTPVANNDDPIAAA